MTKLFILHGWTYQTETWRPLLEMLTARGIDHELLLIPGLTDGTDSPPAGGWTLDDYVGWLEGKTAGHDKIILYGHSNGGRISLAFAAKHPEKVVRLILEDSAGVPPRGMRALKRDIFKHLSKLGGPLSRSETLRSLVHTLLRVSDYRKATPEMRQTMANLVSVDLQKVLGHIQCPTLIVWGAQDTMTPLEDGRTLHEGIKNSRLIVLPDARHSPHITHAQKLADIVAKELTP